ncbi:hypothetical protein Tco_1274461 [Tanacetum coccineum]
MRELRKDTFYGNKNKDAHDYVDRILNIVSLFNILRVSQDAVLLRVFSFTLTGSAKRWVDRLTQGAVNTWDLLKKAFIQRIPLNEEVKQVEEVKYGKFRHPVPFNGGNGAKSRVGPLGYYTRTDNRPPYGEKRLSLEELMNKHQVESA